MEIFSYLINDKGREYAHVVLDIVELLTENGADSNWNKTTKSVPVPVYSSTIIRLCNFVFAPI